MRQVLAVTLALALSLAALPAQAQVADLRTSASPEITALLAPGNSPLDTALAASHSNREASAAFLPLPKYGKWVSVTKWLSLATAVGLGITAAVIHEDAEKVFAELESACQADPDTCRARTPDGAYADPQLESLFQDVADKDRQARLALIGAEVSFGLSVLLFIVDFQKKGGPGDIPYDPDSEKSKLRLTAAPGELAVRYYFSGIL